MKRMFLAWPVVFLAVQVLALDAPSGLTSTRQTALSIALKWTAPTGTTLAGFELQRAPDQSGVPGQPVYLKRYDDAFAATLYTDSTVNKDSYYHYRVRGYQSGFDGSEASTLKSDWTAFSRVKTLEGVGDPKITGALLKPGGSTGSVIEYETLTTGQVDVRIYTVDGALVRTLVNGSKSGPARYSETWGGTNERGEPVASGTYLVHVKSPDQSIIKKIVVVR